MEGDGIFFPSFSSSSGRVGRKERPGTAPLMSCLPLLLFFFFFFLGRPRVGGKKKGSSSSFFLPLSDRRPRARTGGVSCAPFPFFGGRASSYRRYTTESLFFFVRCRRADPLPPPPPLFFFFFFFLAIRAGGPVSTSKFRADAERVGRGKALFFFFSLFDVRGPGANRPAAGATPPLSPGPFGGVGRRRLLLFFFPSAAGGNPGEQGVAAGFLFFPFFSPLFFFMRGRESSDSFSLFFFSLGRTLFCFSFLGADLQASEGIPQRVSLPVFFPFFSSWGGGGRREQTGPFLLFFLSPPFEQIGQLPSPLLFSFSLAVGPRCGKHLSCSAFEVEPRIERYDEQFFFFFPPGGRPAHRDKGFFFFSLFPSWASRVRPAEA